MLSKKNKNYLKSMSNTLKSNYQIGKNEISPTFLDMIDKALTKNELIKISVNRSITDEKEEIANTICKLVKAELIQIIGGVFVIYRRNEKKPIINLPE